MKNFLNQLSIILIILLFSVSTISCNFEAPYGVNSFYYPPSICVMWNQAHINRYRVMVDWALAEPSDNVYNWATGDLDRALINAGATGAKISLCIYNSPLWARINQANQFSVVLEKYSEFIIALLTHCDLVSSGTVEAVEIDNEGATGGNDVERDPSQGYSELLKTGYITVKSYNPSIVVVTGGIWQAAYHFVDDLYQLGCKGYFDRINLHYMTHSHGSGEDPSIPDSVWHMPTAVKYLKYLCEKNGDISMLMRVTQFGWRFDLPTDTNFEIRKSTTIEYTLSVFRKSGFIDRTNIWTGITGGYNPSNNDFEPDDRMAIVYADNEENPSFLYPTTAYFMYERVGSVYNSWNGISEELNVIPGAESNVHLVNPGFETGDTIGWSGAVIDNTEKHRGNYSAKHEGGGSIVSDFYSVEKGKLYEIITWIKVKANSKIENMEVFPCLMYRTDGGSINWYCPPNYYGLVDTEKYPDTWRRIRFMYPAKGNEVAVQFEVYNNRSDGTFWIDDVLINALHLSSMPVISVYPSILEFKDVKIGEVSSLILEICNIGSGTLTGTVSTDRNWLKVFPDSFNFETSHIMVTVDNKILKEKSGKHSGNVFINSNGGNVQVPVSVTATCIVTYPEPYSLKNGSLVFSGDAIIPGKTKIKIMTLSGELIWENNDTDIFCGNKIQWDGKDKNEKRVVPNIYIYTYTSPVEKGAGKITVIK